MTDPLPPNLDRHHVRRMVPGDSFPRIFHRVPDSPTGSFSVLPIWKAPSKAANRAISHSPPSAHKCSRIRSKTSRGCRCLLHLLHCAPTKLQLEIDSGSQVPKSTHSSEALPHGVAEIHYQHTSAGRVHYVIGSDLSLSPCAHPPKPLQVSTFLCRQDAPAVQGPPVWTVHHPKGLYYTSSEPSHTPQEDGDPSSPLPRRPAGPLQFLQSSVAKHTNCHDLSPTSRVPDQPRKKRASAVSTDTASWHDAGHTANESIPDPGLNSEDGRLGAILSTASGKPSHASHTAPRPDSSKYGGAAMGSSPHQRTPMVPCPLSTSNR